MRRSFCVLLLMFICASAFPAKCLVITLADGGKIYYSFDKYVPMIRFVNGTMRVSTRKFEFSRVAEFAVIDDPTTISALEHAPDFSVDGDLLTVASLDPVRIFNAKGVLQKITATASAEAQYVDLSSLPIGVYIVHVGEQSFTVYKR